MSGSKTKLAARYESHHQTARGAGFAVEGDLRSAFFASVIGRGKRVLDLGCRDGTIAAAFSGENEVTGVDVDRNALAQAEASGIQTVWADLGDLLPFEAGSFQVVVAGEVLEHLPDPSALLGEVARVLAPDGTLVGSVPNAFRLKNRLRFLAGRPVEPDPTHLQQFSPSGLARALEASFLEVEITFAASRFLRISPSLFGNSMLFVASRPRHMS